LFLCYLQITFKLIPLEGASFLIDYYPVEWRIEDLITVAVTVMLIGVIASWMPSRRASLQKITLR